MARPKQVEHRKRKRKAEEALARAQKSWSLQNPSVPLGASSAESSQPRAALPPARPAATSEMSGSAGDGVPVIGEVIFQVGGLEEEEEEEAASDGAFPETDDEVEAGGVWVDDEAAEDRGEEEEDGEEASDEDEVDEDEDQGPSRKKAKKNKGTGGHVLPVADLPDDWEGDVEDGATYLALAMRADKALPTYTRAANPYADSAVDVQTTVPIEPAPMLNAAAAGADTQAEAGPSRHPALPKESWQTTFPLHFVAYRKHLAESWPPSPPIPYPPTWPKIPSTSQRGEWGYFINGHPRKKISPPSKPEAGANKGKGKAVDLDEEAGLNGDGGEDGEEDMDMDDEMDEEEAAMNLPGGIIEDVLEPLGEKHKARNPQVCVLQRLDTPGIISVLSTLTTHIQNTLTPLETNLIPPSYDPSASVSRRPHTRKNPFSEHYSRWIFALLLVLDPFLSAGQISVLRELARVIIRVGGWRWVEAVVGGEVGLPASAPKGESTDLADGGGSHWMLGARWKYARDTRDASGVTESEMGTSGKYQIPPNGREEYDETGVDETLARCWVVVHAIAAGWGQKDLVMDLEEMFS